MNYYGKMIVEALSECPRTRYDLGRRTGLAAFFVIKGINSARASGYNIRAVRGARTEDGLYEPTTYMLEGHRDDARSDD